VNSSNLQVGPHEADWQVPEMVENFFAGSLRKYCLVIPVLNEGERIRNLLARIISLGLETQVDIVIVDGGSNDGSLSISDLRELGVRGLLVKVGPGGLSAQLRCAYAFALDKGYEGVITIDGNDKDDPKSIPDLIAMLSKGFDFVQASRFIAGGSGINTPKMRELGIRLIHAPLLSFASGFKWTDTTQGFRAYSRRLLADPNISVFRDVFDKYELLPYLSYIAPKLGFRCAETPSVRSYPDGPIPTKIRGLGAQLNLFLVLLKACTGGYNKKKFQFFSNALKI
jgi:dolichol-phosphate mannosyltransferase